MIFTKISKRINFIILGFVLISHSLTVSAQAFAKMAPPSPPLENPNPPVSEQDKARVAFAQMVIQKLLKVEYHGAYKLDRTIINDDSMHFDLTKSCLQDQACWMADKTLQKYIGLIQAKFGLVKEIRHTHIIPWSFKNFINKTPNKYQTRVSHGHKDSDVKAPVLKADEYMIHSYATFDKEWGWHHLNVIVSEDESGKIVFRRFFIMKMPTAKLPPGVKC